VLYRVNAGGGAIQSTDAGPDWADGSGRTSAAATPRLEPGAERRRDRAGEHAALDLRQRAVGRAELDLPDPGRSDGEGQALLREPVPGHVQVGQRVFNVAINGNHVLSAYDIVADVGDQTGTMKEFPNLTAAPTAPYTWTSPTRSRTR
jgi:hypothetical protein